MVGTILKDDLQSSVEDQLQNYARGLTTVVGDTAADLQRAGRQKLEDVQAELTSYANQVQSGVTQINQPPLAGAQAANPLQILSDYATEVSNRPPAVQEPIVAGAPAVQSGQPA